MFPLRVWGIGRYNGKIVWIAAHNTGGRNTIVQSIPKQIIRVGNWIGELEWIGNLIIFELMFASGKPSSAGVPIDAICGFRIIKIVRGVPAVGTVIPKLKHAAAFVQIASAS